MRKLKVEFELEQDGRWIAAIEELPGVPAYGGTGKEARPEVEAPARQVTAARSIRKNR
jgi:predicted RNase H-like HicB family nuclease